MRRKKVRFSNGDSGGGGGVDGDGDGDGNMATGEILSGGNNVAGCYFFRRDGIVI